MGVIKKILSIVGWIITIVLQMVLGQIGATFAVGMGRGKMPLSLVYAWLATTAGIFLIGALAVMLCRSVRPKKYLSRLGLTGAGALIPYIILIFVGMNQKFNSEVISGGLGFLLTLLALILGLIGFYIPGWIKSRKPV